MTVRLHHSVIFQEAAVAADGIATYDLAVNPLSVVLVCLRPLLETSTLTNFQGYRALCAAMNRVAVNFRAQSVFSMRGEDAAALNYFRHGMSPMLANADDTDNERIVAVLPILLGRFAYDSQCCFPATRRGELQLEIDWDIADTGYDGMRVSVEAIELLGANPKEFERKTTLYQTNAATGIVDHDLPVGNTLRGILAWGTTDFTGATPAPSLGRMGIAVDNQEVGYASTDFEVAHMLNALSGRMQPSNDGHTHRVDATAAVTTEETTRPINLGADYENYAWLDLDPTRDDELSIDTAGSSRASLRCDIETANAVRVISVERVKLGKAA